MTLTAADVEHVALLARLGLDESEKRRFASQLDAILEAVSKLQGVNTSDIAETAQVGELVNVWRDDVPTPSIGADAALRNAPATDGSYFLVGAIQENELDE